MPIPATMTALVVAAPGHPPVIQAVSRPVPAPAPGEALLRVDACGFCHHDRLVMDGALRRGVAPGVVLGHEISGVIASVGDGVAAVRPGDRVVPLLTSACGSCDRCRLGREHRCRNGAGIGHGRDGGFAEYLLLPASALAPVPHHIPAPLAALLACPAGVALDALRAARLTAGRTVVITGASGGLGTCLIQLAAAQQARVIAVTSSPHRTAALESLGASCVIPLDDDLDFSQILLALTDDAGADVVIDTVGPSLWPSTLRCLGQYGRMILLGDLTGASVTLRLAETIFRDLTITGHSGVSRAGLLQAIRMAADGILRPLVSHTLPMTPQGLTEAWHLVSRRLPVGRIVLLPERPVPPPTQ